MSKNLISDLIFGHKQLRKREEYTAVDVWNYMHVSYAGRGMYQSASYTTTEWIEEQRARLLSQVIPPTAEDLARIEQLVDYWKLDTVLHAVDEAVQNADTPPTLAEVANACRSARAWLVRAKIQVSM